MSMVKLGAATVGLGEVPPPPQADMIAAAMHGNRSHSPGFTLRFRQCAARKHRAWMNVRSKFTAYSSVERTKSTVRWGTAAKERTPSKET